MATREAEVEEEAGSVLEELEIDDCARFGVNLESRLVQGIEIVRRL